MKCTSGVDSTPTQAVATRAKETAAVCILVVAADEQSGVLAVDEAIVTNARKNITTQDRRKPVGVSTLNGYRSAIESLTRPEADPSSSFLREEHVTFFTVLKRLQASMYQSGSLRESGKDPLPLSINQELCKTTIEC
ncbi:hypothetical protein ON010_g16729 [Phytophthora cinnamomi]|nr:hypothetical protein ON010_g16729 [Phytophthora cinnamomi]